MILVDSDVLIAHLRGGNDAMEWLVRVRRETGPLAASVVSVAEGGGGTRTSERRAVGRLFATLRLFPVSERIAWRSAELHRTYRRSHSGIGLGDYLVAATAEVEGCALASLNVRHFPMFEDLQPPF